MRRSSLALAAALAAFALSPAVASPPAPTSTLVGRSVLPADTFAPGPTAGRHLGAAPINGRTPPFVDKHPVQGFSAVLANGDGTFLLCGDNGFGFLENSADHRLRAYTVRPRFRSATDPRGGEMAVLGFIELHDPDRHLPYPITHQFTAERPLTGADLDIESVQRAPDGTLWFGDEFGPFLIHTDARGKVLEAPYPLPDADRPGFEIRSPQNPFDERQAGIRVMNALRADAEAHGALRSLVFSPNHLLLADGDATTRSPSRPAGATSDVHDPASLRAAGHRVVPWTVNDAARMRALLTLGVDGLISDRPDLLYQAVAGFDANKDGRTGDYLLPDGRIDPRRFDAQGHRGGRDLRPENTLPAFEVALDHLMNTLETDCALTGDNKVVLSHDPLLESAKVRRADQQPYRHGEERRIKDLTLDRLQREFVADRPLPDRPLQRTDSAASPVSVAFAEARALPHAYAVPALGQLFDFVGFYVDYYRTGAGRVHPEAERRWRNAEAVRYNLEIKTSPAWERSGLTGPVGPFTRAVTKLVEAHHLAARTHIQSFDHRALRWVHREAPAIATAYLLGDHMPFGFRAPGAPNTGPEDPGVYPFGQTAPARARKTGGFEGLAIAPDGRTLYPILEKPLVGDDPRTLLIHAFDVASRRYTPTRHRYRLAPGSTSVPDFILLTPDRGLVIERDDREGRLDATKHVVGVTLGAPETYVGKTLVADLLRLADPFGLSLDGRAGDVGLGDPFALPYFTIEGLVRLGPRRLGVVTDNNYPFSVGRHRGTGQPDDSEFVVIETATPLAPR